MWRNVPDTLMNVNEEATRSRAAVLRPRRAAAPEAVGRGARRAVQGARRPGAGGDRESARRPGRGVHLQPDRLPRAVAADRLPPPARSEEHTSELQSHVNLVCRLLLEK